MPVHSIALSPFLPANDYAQSLVFYQALGFSLRFHDQQLARFEWGDCVFFVQNRPDPALASSLMLLWQVGDVAALWMQISPQLQIWGVPHTPPAEREWRWRDFIFHDPAGVLWRAGQPIAQEIEP
jgi:catechol 2,3-dioxygenase-like lactoylglutathione lyase family enzyme